MSADSRAIATRFYEILNDWTPAGLDEVCAPDLRGHAGAGANLADLKESFDSFHSAFPDMQVEVRQLVCEGDLVSSWLSWRATHQGDFAGVPASGRSVRFAAWDLLRIQHGQVVEITQYCDLFTIMNQIGVLPTVTPA